MIAQIGEVLDTYWRKAALSTKAAPDTPLPPTTRRGARSRQACCTVQRFKSMSPILPAAASIPASASNQKRFSAPPRALRTST